MGKVFKVCEEDEWEAIKDNEFYEGSKSDQSDGFIHLSTSKQLKETFEKHFKFKSPLYLLEVKTNDLELVWERSRNNQLFPHLYKPMPLRNVCQIYKVFMNTTGRHIIPEHLLKINDHI